MTTPTAAQPLLFAPSTILHVPGAGEVEFIPDPPPAPPPGRPTYGKPYTRPTADGTRRVVAHKQVSCFEFGGGWDGFGLVSGYLQSVTNAASAGLDGWACDMGSADIKYTSSFANILTAINQRNQSNGGLVNAKSVGPFGAYIVYDMSTFAEDAAAQQAMAQIFLAHCHDPAYMTHQGRPILSTYTGEGGSWANVKAVFGAVLAIIRAAGVNPFFLPGFLPTASAGGYIDRTNAAGVAAWASGLLRGFADGAWQYASGGCPLGPGSGIPGDEMCSAACADIGVPYQRSLLPHYWGSGHGGIGGGTRFYEEYRGGAGVKAYAQSIIRDPNAFLMQIETYDDFEEGGYISLADPNLHWPYLQHGSFPGYYVSKAGLGKELDYWLMWYRTRQQPLVADDTLIYYVRPQTAAVTLSQPDPYGPITQVDNPDTDPPGVLQDLLFVTAILKTSGYVQVQFLDPSGAVIAGATSQRFVEADLSQIAVPFVAGVPVITLLRDNQPVLALTAPAIAATASCINANYMTGCKTI